MYDIVTCGSGTVDVFAQTENELISIETPTHKESLIAFPNGSKILIDKLEFSVGGGGTNTAVGFARQGFKTGWIGCIGGGTNADLIKQCLKKEKVAFLGHTSKISTGYSIILNARDHDRTILAHKGSNNELKFSKLKLPKTKKLTKWFYFSSMVSKSYQAQRRLAVYAKNAGIPIAFNPSSYQVSQGMEALRPILKATTILIFNKEESEILCGTADRKSIFKTLHDEGVETIIITDGPKKLYASQNGKDTWVQPDDVPPIETTGAGDAFACGFVGMYMRGKTLKQCLKAGIANGQSVITHHGAKEKLLSKNALLKAIK